MYFSYKGFCPMFNGEETITIEGKDIKGKWIYGFVTDEAPNGDIYVKPKYGSYAYLCMKETVDICIPCIKDTKDKEVYTGDIVEFYTEIRNRSLDGFTRTTKHIGKVVYNTDLHEFVIDADITYSLDKAKDITIIGQEFVNNDIELK